jgi:hypothetical protein
VLIESYKSTRYGKFDGLHLLKALIGMRQNWVCQSVNSL